MIHLSTTSQGEAKRTDDGRWLIPVNVCQDGTSPTITAHQSTCGPASIFDLGHFPKMAVLVRYGETIKY